MQRLAAATWMALLCVFCLTSNATSTTIEKTEISAPSALVSSLEHETSVPVHDNRFVVDKDIQSLQVIINTDDVQSIKILGPGGIEILPLQNNESINWQQIDKLFAITIKKPAIGQWEIKGKMLATAKIIVDSALKLITPDFPNNLFRGETLTISAYLTDNNKRVMSKEILSQTQFFATLHNVATFEKYKIFLTDDETKPEGIYRFDYDLQTLPGVYRLSIDVMSLLFQRQQEQQFYLYDYPATFTTKIISDTNELLIEVDLQNTILDEPTCRFTALYMGRDGEMSSVPLRKISDTKWQLFTPVSDATHKMNLLLNAYTIDRRLVNITFPDVDVFTMYQNNLSDVRSLWAERWRIFWQQNEDRQLSFMLGFSKDKILERLLFSVNEDLPKSAIPLREYPTYQESLLKAWEPFIFAPKPITLVEKLSAPVSEHQAVKALEPNKGVVALPVKATPIVAATKPLPMPSPWRKWLIGLFVVLVILFIGLLLGIVWVFQEAKMRALYAKVQPRLVALLVTLKKMNIKIGKGKEPEPEPALAAEAVPVVAEASSAESAPVAEAAPSVESAPVAEAAPSVEPAPVAEAVPLTQPTNSLPPQQSA